MWRLVRWSDHQYYPANKCGGLYVGPTTNIRHGILAVFANRPPVGPTTPVRHGALLVGPTTPVRRGGFIDGSASYFRRGILVVFANRSPIGPTRPVRRWGLEGPPTPEQFTVKAHPALFGGVREGGGEAKKGGTITQQTILKVYTLVRPPI